LARTVKDSAIVLEVIAGHDRRDPTTSRRAVERYSAALDGDVRGLKVGVPREHYWDRLDGEIEQGVRAAIERLSELGAEVVEVSLPWVDHAFAPANLISWVEASAYHTPWKQHWAADYGLEIQQRLLIGQAISGADYLLAQRARRAIVDRTRAILERVDLLATPTCPIPAPRIEEEIVQVGREREPVRSAVGRLCRLGALVGFPVVAVPCGFTASGLPIGLHLLAAPFRESTALRAAHAYEQATEWHLRRPPLG
jgi:aspartyl-tRNA(Asn)/glutamyl-tRNA(Gln) amidotransferase subunit A